MAAERCFGVCCLSVLCVLRLTHAHAFKSGAKQNSPIMDQIEGAEDSCLMQKGRPRLSTFQQQEGTALVSASFGGRDARTVMPPCPEDMRCVLYTDREVLEDHGWLVSTEPYHAKTEQLWPELNSGGRHSWAKITNDNVRNLMAAKFYKMNMFLLPELEGIDVILWHDSYFLRDWFHSQVSFADRLRLVLQDFDLAIEKHPDRNDVRSELKPAANRARDTTHYWAAENDVNEAYEHQRALQFTDTVGLYHCGRYVLKVSPEIRSAFSAWWHEVQDFTFRDQISFPYIMQSFNLRVRVFESKHLWNAVTGSPGLLGVAANSTA